MQKCYQENLDEQQPIFLSENTECDLVREAIERTNSFSLLVSGESMHPLFLAGNKLKVESVSLDRMRPGDIVVYEVNSKIYSHRLMRRSTASNQEFLLTKGDANLFWDAPLTRLAKKSVIGKATAVHRNGQLIDLTSKSWRTAGLLVATISDLTARAYDRANRQKPTFIGGLKLGLSVARILRRLTILSEYFFIFALVGYSLGRSNNKNMIRIHGSN